MSQHTQEACSQATRIQFLWFLMAKTQPKVEVQQCIGQQGFSAARSGDQCFKARLDLPCHPHWSCPVMSLHKPRKFTPHCLSLPRCINVNWQQNSWSWSHGSGSIGKRFTRLLDFVKTLISFFPISPSQTRVGMVVFSSSPYPIFPFNRYYSKTSIIRAVDRVRFPYGGTKLGRALRFVSRYDYRDRTL